MKVEDASKIYEFLSHIQLLGFIGICLLVVLSVLFFVIPKDKLATTPLIFLILLISLAPLIILYIQSKKNNELKYRATFIKQDFAFRHFRQASLRWLSQVTLNNTYDLAKTKDHDQLVKMAFALQEQFPDEFLIVYMNTGAKDDVDKFGLCIIDPILIKKNEDAIKENAERTADIATQLMASKKIDTLYINTDLAIAHNCNYSLRQLNDEYWHIGPDFYTAMIGRKNLIPVYEIRKESSGKFQNYGNIIAFTLVKGSQGVNTSDPKSNK